MIDCRYSGRYLQSGVCLSSCSYSVYELALLMAYILDEYNLFNPVIPLCESISCRPQLGFSVGAVPCVSVWTQGHRFCGMWFVVLVTHLHTYLQSIAYVVYVYSFSCLWRLRLQFVLCSYIAYLCLYMNTSIHAPQTFTCQRQFGPPWNPTLGNLEDG